MEAKHDIIEVATNETVRYMDELNMNRVFENLLRKYIGYHNKGIYVRFDFGTATPKDYYGVYANRYNLSRDLLAEFDESVKVRDVRIKISNLETKNDKIKSSLREKRDKWKSDLRDMEKALESEVGKENASSKGIAIQKSLIGIYEDHLALVKTSEQKAMTTSIVLSRMSKNYKKIRSSFDLVEKNFIVQIVAFFLKKIEENVAPMFARHTFRIECSMKEIMKRYESKKDNQTFRSYGKKSAFESEIMGILEIAKTEFSVILTKGVQEYRLSASKGYFTTSVQEKNARYHYSGFGGSKQSNDGVLDPMNKFLSKHPGFLNCLNALSGINKNFGRDHSAVNEVINLLNQHFPETVLREYQLLHTKLYEEMKAEKENKPKWLTGENAITVIMDVFEELQFEKGVKEDENMKLMMERFADGKDNDLYLIHYIGKIENDTHVLKIA